MMPFKRIGHRKSRNGCTRCKARRVKCDEQRPCNNCVRHNVECSLAASITPQHGTCLSSSSTSAFHVSPENSPEVTQQRPRDNSTLSIQLSIASSDRGSVRQDDPFRGPEDGVSVPAFGSQGNDTVQQPVYSAQWMQSLHLLHYFCISTCKTLSRNPLQVETCRNVIPQIASKCEYLMHALLAVTALHYAHTHADKHTEFRIQSATYQNLALRDFTQNLQNISNDNCEALFLVAWFTFIIDVYNISNPCPDEQAEPIDVARLFILLQGVRGVINFKSSEKWCQDGFLGPIMQPIAETTPVVDENFSRRMERLTCLARKESTNCDVINQRSACILAIESLRHIHSVLLREEDSTVGARKVWAWILSLPPLFIEMLGSGHPVAMVILAHFAALERPYEYDDWARDGWSAKVVNMIERTLGPQSPLIKWIDWPKRSLEKNVGVRDMDMDEP